MPGEHLNAHARRVVIGLDAEGRSCIESDGPTPHRLAGPGNTKCEIWRIPTVPASCADGDGIGEIVRLPPEAGLVYRISAFPPDSELEAPTDDAASGQAVNLGMHATDTVDIVTILTGEVYALTETGETLLRPGDTLVQRGTVHSWSNRTDKPVTFASVMIAATP